jgi:hypothetical protein
LPIPWTKFIHSTPSHLKNQFNIIILSTSTSFKWFFHLKFPWQNVVCVSCFPHICPLPRPSRSWFYHPTNKNVKLLIVDFFLRFPITCSHLTLNNILSTAC